jgi:phage shock protein A
MNELLERKTALKNRIDALSRELQPHLRAVENLRNRIDTLETDYRYVLDKIREEGTKHEQAAA